MQGYLGRGDTDESYNVTIKRVSKVDDLQRLEIESGNSLMFSPRVQRNEGLPLRRDEVSTSSNPISILGMTADCASSPVSLAPGHVSSLQTHLEDASISDFLNTTDAESISNYDQLPDNLSYFDVSSPSPSDHVRKNVSQQPPKATHGLQVSENDHLVRNLATAIGSRPQIADFESEPLRLSKTTFTLCDDIAHNVTGDIRIRQLPQTPMHGGAPIGGRESFVQSLPARRFLAKIVPEKIQQPVLQHDASANSQKARLNKMLTSRKRKAANQNCGDAKLKHTAQTEKAGAKQSRKSKRARTSSRRKKIKETQPAEPDSTRDVVFVSAAREPTTGVVDFKKIVTDETLSKDLKAIATDVDCAASQFNNHHDESLISDSLHETLCRMKHEVTLTLLALVFERSQSAIVSENDKNAFCASTKGQAVQFNLFGGVESLLNLLYNISAHSDCDQPANRFLRSAPQSLASGQRYRRGTVPHSKLLVWLATLVAWPADLLRRSCAAGILRLLALPRYSTEVFNQCYSVITRQLAAGQLAQAKNNVEPLLRIASVDAVPSLVYYACICSESSSERPLQIAAHIGEEGRLVATLQIQRQLLQSKQTIYADLVRFCMMDVYRCDTPARSCAFILQVLQNYADDYSTPLLAFFDMLHSNNGRSADMASVKLCDETLRWMMTLPPSAEAEKKCCVWLIGFAKSRGVGKALNILLESLHFAAMIDVELKSLYDSIAGKQSPSQIDGSVASSIAPAFCSDELTYVQLPVALRRCSSDGSAPILIFDGLGKEHHTIQLLCFQNEPPEVLCAQIEDMGCVDDYEVLVRPIDKKSGKTGKPAWLRLKADLGCESWTDNTFGLAWCAKVRSSLFLQDRYVNCRRVANCSIDSLDKNGGNRLQSHILHKATQQEAHNPKHVEQPLSQRFVRLYHRSVLVPVGDGNTSLQLADNDVCQFVDKSFLKRVVAQALEQEAASGGVQADEFVESFCQQNDNTFMVDAVQLSK